MKVELARTAELAPLSEALAFEAARAIARASEVVGRARTPRGGEALPPRRSPAAGPPATRDRAEGFARGEG